MDFENQIKFIQEIDKLKDIVRNNKIMSSDRRENDAEHSWHICMMALTLSEYADSEIDISRVVRMLLIHDLVEIYAGDEIVYNTGTKEHAIRELEAAHKIFGILPQKQYEEYFGLWQEFESRDTNDSKFARAIDRLEPIMQITQRDGDVWRKNSITPDRILGLNKIIADGSQKLWEYAKQLVNECVDKGFI